MGHEVDDIFRDRDHTYTSGNLLLWDITPQSKIYSNGFNFLTLSELLFIFTVYHLGIFLD